MSYIILIKEYDTDEVVETIPVNSTSERMAYKVDRGLNINLNHELYYTEITKQESQ